MDDTYLQERPGFFSRVAGMFARTEVYEEEEVTPRAISSAPVQLRPSYSSTVVVRRQVASFEDAMAAANGLKCGEQQILNLSFTEPTLRQKIVDFMSGVNYAQEGTWEEVGDNIYLVVPATAYVEVVPATARTNFLKN